MIVAIADENKSMVDQEALGLGKSPDKARLLKNYVLMTKLAALERVRDQIKQASNNHLLYTEAIEGVMNDGKI